MATYAIKWNEEILVTIDNVLMLEWYTFTEKELIASDEMKVEQKEAILKIASLSDQLNLTAGTLDLVVDLLAVTNPELLEHPWIIESKSKLNKIKTILNK